MIWKFILAIPDLIKLLAALEQAAKKAETARKVRDDLKALQKAIDDKDASSVAHIFNS